MDENGVEDVDDCLSDRASRIDLKSGFMKQIIRNQQNRDEYDKEIKLKQMKTTPKISRETRGQSKRPEQVRYTPPTKGNQVERPMSSTAASSTIVFKLQYEDPDGDVSEWLVHKGDDPQSLAERFGRQCQLTPPLITALGSLIKEEMVKRGLQQT